MTEVINLTINPDEPVTELPSLCVNCKQQGITRLLLCQVPFFRDIIVSSFNCDACGFSNNSVQEAGTLADRGVRIVLNVGDKLIMDRQVVKSENATLTIPEIGLEIPAKTQSGSFNTVEGILEKTKEHLEWDQEARREADPELAAKMDEFLGRLQQLIDGVQPFQFILDDPSGNSFIAHDPAYGMAYQDPFLQIVHYNRTKQQMVDMGYMDEADQLGQAVEDMQLQDPLSLHGVNLEQPLDEHAATEEPVEFPTECYACHRQGTTRIALTRIPQFKALVIMAFSCDFCGAKSNDMKPGGEVSPMGRRITLQVTDIEDLKRDVYKGDSATIHIPELGLEITRGSLGALVTTVEGLLVKIREDLGNVVGFHIGDSNTAEEDNRYMQFLHLLDTMQEDVAQPFTIIIEDPLANSHIGMEVDDPKVRIEEYERSEEDNIDLGIADMHVQ